MIITFNLSANCGISLLCMYYTICLWISFTVEKVLKDRKEGLDFMKEASLNSSLQD